MTSTNTMMEEKKVVALMRKSQTYGGCSTLIGLFGALVTVPFFLMLLITLFFFATGDMSGQVAIILGAVSALSTVVGAVTIWFSWTSFKINRTQALESKHYIKTIRARKAAQHGSISLSAPDHVGGGLGLVDHDERHHDDQHAVALDLSEESQAIEAPQHSENFSKT